MISKKNMSQILDAKLFLQLSIVFICEVENSF